jgi:jumonji domain-containing protein 2
MSETNCPVYRPTEEEFKCFESYITKIDRERGDCGIVKVIPPEGWYKCDEKNLYDNAMSFRTPNPVRQSVSGLPGVFTITHFELKPLTLNDFIVIDGENCYKEPNFEKREYKFWKSLGKASPWPDPIYGADVPGSLFKDSLVSESTWNLDKLDSMLRYLPHNIPGVSRSMLYFGSWRAMFAFHVEDYNLYSINFLHTGAEKSWYSIPLNYKQRFENMAQASFMEDYNDCREFMRHKTKMISPKRLKENGIAFNTVVQCAGEFVITFPGSYHAGFNHGLNVAEATNFAFPQWLPHGRNAKRCVCRPNAVTIDVDCLEAKYLRKLYSYNCINGESNINNIRSNLENVVDTQRIRCICNKIENSNVTIDDLVLCKSCRLKYHKICVENATKQSNVCHICYALDNDIEIPVYFNPQNNWQSFSKNGNLKVSKQKRAVKRRKPNQILTGDFVRTNLNNTNTIVEGIISAIEDGLGRLHIKGMKKEQDVWVSLEDCSLIELIENHSVVEADMCDKTINNPENGRTLGSHSTNYANDTNRTNDNHLNNMECGNCSVDGIQHGPDDTNDTKRIKVSDTISITENLNEVIDIDFDFLSIHPDVFFESQKIVLKEDLMLIGNKENIHEEYTSWMKQALMDIVEIEIDGSEHNIQYLQSILAEGIIKCKFKNTRGFLSVLCLYAQSKRFDSIRKLAKKYLSLLAYNFTE